ncbi:MAG: hypothetical protein V4574_17395 [Pseudomonadota bacterium]
MTDSAYFISRAERHRRLAEAAGHPSARAAHEQLASAYAAKASAPHSAPRRNRL